MKLVKPFILLVIAYYVAATKPKAENFEAGARPKSLKCWSDNETVLVKACSLKAQSRRLVTASVHFVAPNSIDRPIYARAILNVRTGYRFHTMIDTKEVDWCGIMDGKDGHLFAMLLINQMKASAPSLFHKCPYSVIDLKNVSGDDTIFDDTNWIPSGLYRNDVMAYKNGKMILCLNITFEVKHGRDMSFYFDTLVKKLV
jgi:hypothetical protein